MDGREINSFLGFRNKILEIKFLRKGWRKNLI